MVGIDVSVFYFNEIGDHVCGRCQAFVKDSFHNVTYLRLEPIVPLQLWNLDVDHDLPELFIDFIGAVNRWVQQTGYLLANKHLKGALRHKEAGREGTSVLDGCLDVLLGQVLKWINFVDHFVEYLVENEVDSGTTLALDRYLLHELSFNLVSVRVQKLVDHSKNHGSFVFH